LPGAFNVAGLVAGFIVVLVGYTGPLLIVLQAASNAGLTQAETSSWVWAIAIGNGVTTIIMSLWYRQPLTAPWSTAGAALLVTSLALLPYNQAIGAYILAGLGIVLLGISGLFGRAMSLVPPQVVQGMLAGILLRFGIGVFTNLPGSPVMVIAMVATFFLAKRFAFRAPGLVTLVVGVVIALISGDLHFGGVTLGLTVPHFTAPVFTPEAALSLAFPLMVLALTSQYATGQAVLRSSGYEAPINGILVFTGAATMILAPFGNHGTTLGALTAAMVTNADVQPDHSKRYAAAVTAGLWYVLFGLFGATIVTLFAGFPAELVAAVAGLALLGAIGSSLAGAMNDPDGRDSGLVAFLCTAGEFSLLGIGAPFWGLVAGVLVHLLLRWRKNS
jgi:benzoate membrane transport protein